MKKFKNLIENRIKHKNNLLKADVKRLYPMNKLMTRGHYPFALEHSKIPLRTQKYSTTKA